MSGLHFFDLPTELIIKTLTELSVVDLRNCEATNNRFLSGLIRDSASLQYGVEKKLACIDDTPYSLWNNSLVDRARNLRLRRRAWLEFSCIHTRSITVDHAATSLYELESDIYFLAGVGGRVSGLSNAIKYVHIPASEVPKGTGSDWEHLEIGRPVVDFAAAIDAHNLMAVVTYTPHRSDNYMLSVDIVLVDFSTRKHHQLARKPDPVAISDTGATFLAEDTILLPNGKGNSLDVYRIPRTGEAAIQIHSFHLPPLMPSYCVTSAICKDSPTCSQATSATRRRYTSDFEKSLVVVSFDITVDDDDEGEQFLFVFLRNEFMDMLEDRTNTGHSSTEWPLWGRSLTRWLDMSGTNYHMSHGRRFVWISNEGDDLQPIYVLDFNPDAVTLAREMNTISPTAAIHVVPRHEVKITRYHAFQGLVESTLPYVETVSREDFTYHSVAINEDNILGFKFTDSDDFAVKSIDVLQFGPL
ncbi:hypothetical protein DFH06DRAFT_1392564 [Mycena polygramma]|nr:hypothetical protein DFH06DRAFT_1392564 [Mycena polygramma]